MQCLPENSFRKYRLYGSSADPNTNEYTDPWSYGWLLFRAARRESVRISFPTKPLNMKYALKKRFSYYIDVAWASLHPKSPATLPFVPTFVQGDSKEGSIIRI